MWLKSNRQFLVNIAMVVFGYFMGAAQPQNRWQWAQFGAGIGLAVAGVVKAAWNEIPGTANVPPDTWRQG